jgi:hypothetical protein
MTDDKAERKRAAEYVRQLVAEQRKRREAHEASFMRAGPIVEGRKLSTKAILQHLAVAKRSHEWFHPGDPYARIPAALIDAIAIAVAGARTWSKVLAKLEASNEERVGKAAHRSRRWQAKADKVWENRPDHSARRVAELIAELGENPDTIRRAIVKPER